MKITNSEEYVHAVAELEVLLSKTANGGFSALNEGELEALDILTYDIAEYEDVYFGDRFIKDEPDLQQ